MKKELILGFALTFTLYSCTGKEQKQENKVKLVKVMEVASSNKAKTISFPGKVKAGQEADVAFRISGPIAKIYVKEGQKVRKGQVLAKMDDRDYRLQLSATTAEYKRIKSEVDRVVKLYEQQSVTANEYDKAVFGLKQITAKLNAHKNALNDVFLKAPFDGYISGKALFREGELVRAGMPVLRLSGGKESVVEINIPASQFLHREDFADYYATFSVFPNKEFPLTEPSVDSKANLNQLYKMTFKLVKQADKQQPTAGMTTMVHIKMKAGKDEALTIPNNAVFEKEGKSFVWLVKGQGDDLHIEAKAIHIEEIFRDGMVACTGLDGQVRIISAGVHQLKDGEAVRPIPEKSATNVGGLL